MRIEQVIMLVKLLKNVVEIVADFLPEGAFDIKNSDSKSFFWFLSQ